MRVLVTGGAGFIGSHLIDRLVRGHVVQVTVVDNLRRGRIDNLDQSWDRIQFIEGDIRDRQLMRDVMQGTDLVYHLAAQSNVMAAQEDEDYCFRTNVEGTLNVLQAARDASVQRVVFSSSREVYGDPRSIPVPEAAPLNPKNAYGASKVAGEAYCCAIGKNRTETVVLRLANVYGRRDFGRVIPIFVERALRCEPLMVYGGDQILDFVWIDTVVESLIRAGTGPVLVGPFNVGSGHPVTLVSLAERILSETSSGAGLQFLPGRSIEVSEFVADTCRMKGQLGVEPDREPLTHLSSLIEWTRGQFRCVGQTPARVFPLH